MYVMTTVKDFVTERAAEQEIHDRMQAACNVLPDTIRDACKQWVDQFGALPSYSMLPVGVYWL